MILEKQIINSPIYWNESEREGILTAIFDVQEVDEEGRAINYIEKVDIPANWQDDFLKVKELTFVLFKKVKVLVAVGTRFYASAQYKSLPWWKRMMIRIELMWHNVQF